MQTQIAYKNDLGHELVAFGAEGVTAEQIAKVNGFESGTWREITMEEASELAEADALRFPEPSLEEKASTIRQQRNALLLATDYRMMPDYPMSELCRENLKLYRQLLRDIPEQPGFPNSVVWPIKGE